MNYGEQVIRNTGVEIRTDSIHGFAHSLVGVYNHLDRNAFTNIDKTELLKSGSFGAAGGGIAKYAGGLLTTKLGDLADAMIERKIMSLPLAERLMAVSNAITPNLESAMKQTADTVTSVSGAVGGYLFGKKVKSTLNKRFNHGKGSSGHKNSKHTCTGSRISTTQQCTSF